MNQDRHPLGAVKMRSRGQAERGKQQQWQKNGTIPIACWEARPDSQARGRPGIPKQVPGTTLAPHQLTPHLNGYVFIFVVTLFLR